MGIDVAMHPHYGKRSSPGECEFRYAAQANALCVAETNIEFHAWGELKPFAVRGAGALLFDLSRRRPQASKKPLRWLETRSSANERTFKGTEQ